MLCPHIFPSPPLPLTLTREKPKTYLEPRSMTKSTPNPLLRPHIFPSPPLPLSLTREKPKTCLEPRFMTKSTPNTVKTSLLLLFTRANHPPSLVLRRHVFAHRLHASGPRRRETSLLTCTCDLNGRGWESVCMQSGIGRQQLLILLWFSCTFRLLFPQHVWNNIGGNILSPLEVHNNLLEHFVRQIHRPPQYGSIISGSNALNPRAYLPGSLRRCDQACMT